MLLCLCSAIFLIPLFLKTSVLFQAEVYKSKQDDVSLLSIYEMQAFFYHTYSCVICILKKKTCKILFCFYKNI